MPKIEAAWVEEPAARHPVLDVTLEAYACNALGDAAGLATMGVHLERLPPGARSSLRHWHDAEDEFVYVLAGAVVLVEGSETPLGTGDAAGWKAGAPVGHCLENRGADDAVYLVVGTRAERDVVHYPDQDLVLEKTGPARRYTRADGSPVGQAYPR